MKKTLIVLLSVLTVVFMATAALAVEVSYEGKVSVKWGNVIDPEVEGDDKEVGFAKDALEAKVTVDLTEDFGDGVTAGVKTKVQAHGDLDTGTNHPTNDDGDLIREFDFDGSGWIQLERDLFAAKASTGIDGGVGKDFGEYGLDSAPGLGLDLKLIDGLTINTLVNAGPKYRYLVKGEFAHDLFTLGGGYQNDTKAEKTAFGINGTANVIDGLAISAEYGNRKEGTADAITAILASAAYDVDALSVKGTFLMQDAGFKSLSDDDADQDWRIIDAYRFTGGVIADATAVAVDASYDVTEDFVIDGYFDYLLNVKIGDEKQDLEDPYAYKVGATYTLDALKLAGWYKAAGSEKSQVGGKATYALAEDVDASFELDYDMVDGQDGKVAYTAKVTAAL